MVEKARQAVVEEEQLDKNQFRLRRRYLARVMTGHWIERVPVKVCTVEEVVEVGSQLAVDAVSAAAGSGEAASGVDSCGARQTVSRSAETEGHCGSGGSKTMQMLTKV